MLMLLYAYNLTIVLFAQAARYPQELREWFEVYCGKVVDCHIFPATGKKICLGLVEFANEADARRLICSSTPLTIKCRSTTSKGYVMRWTLEYDLRIAKLLSFIAG